MTALYDISLLLFLPPGISFLRMPADIKEKGGAAKAEKESNTWRALVRRSRFFEQKFNADNGNVDGKLFSKPAITLNAGCGWPWEPAHAAALFEVFVKRVKRNTFT